MDTSSTRRAPPHESDPETGEARPEGGPDRDVTLKGMFLATDWLRMLPAASQERVIAQSHQKTYSPKEIVAHKGAPATYWVGVFDGLLKVNTVTISGRNVMFSAVPHGSWVGEGSVIKGEPRKYDLIAMRTSRVILVPRGTLLWLLETSITFNRYIIDHLNERAGQFLAMREVSGIDDPIGRVAGAICGLFNPVLYPRAGPMLNISQEEIGELAGLSRGTTNSSLMKLKKLGLVDTAYGGLLVHDLERLRGFVYATEDDPAQESTRR